MLSADPAVDELLLGAPSAQGLTRYQTEAACLGGPQPRNSIFDVTGLALGPDPGTKLEV